eukprot:520259-Pyramimonas_sp.AAC.1
MSTQDLRGDRAILATVGEQLATGWRQAAATSKPTGLLANRLSKHGFADRRTPAEGSGAGR